jgi:hypothetical protein
VVSNKKVVLGFKIKPKMAEPFSGKKTRKSLFLSTSVRFFDLDKLSSLFKKQRLIVKDTSGLQKTPNSTEFKVRFKAC